MKTPVLWKTIPLRNGIIGGLMALATLLSVLSLGVYLNHFPLSLIITWLWFITTIMSAQTRHTGGLLLQSDRTLVCALATLVFLVLTLIRFSEN